ncbi:response regulator [Psychromonas sp. MME2]|uniref:response regulator n=1 Tax=unclassified Psychromonas TaxID=2614957 RepID=UPI00339BE04C
MADQKIVVVEDEADILEILTYNLQREGFDVVSASNGIQGLQLIRDHLPDIALLDLMLPGMDGLDICKQLRSQTETANIPIIMVTAKSEESDIVLGLGLGADDYVSKPFSPKELIARIKSTLRRGQHRVEKSSSNTQDCIAVAGLVIDSDKHKVTYLGEKVKLTATEFRLLHFLASHPGRVFSREQLMNNAYSTDVIVVDRNIDVHVRSIRKKIGEQHQFIETIRGVGYSFKDSE